MMDLPSNYFDQVCKAWRVSVRHILNLDARIHNVMLPSLIGSPGAEKQVHGRMLAMFMTGLNHPSGLISFFFKNCIMNKNSYMSRNIHCINSIYNINLEDVMNKSYQWDKNKAEAKTSISLRCSLAKELLMDWSLEG